MARSVVNTPSIYSLGYLAIMLLSTVFSLYYSFYYIDTLGLGVGMYALARGIYVFWDAAVQPGAGVGDPAGVLHRGAHPRHRSHADPVRRSGLLGHGDDLRRRVRGADGDL